MGLDTSACRKPRDSFSKRAFPRLAHDVGASPQLILQELMGWTRLFEATALDPKSTRSPFYWSDVDSPLSALENWSREQEARALNIESDEGLEFGLQLALEILLLKQLASLARTRGVSVKEVLRSDPYDPGNSPTSPLELLAKASKEIIEKSGLVADRNAENIVVYTAPRFLPDRLQKIIEGLIASVVIDQTLPAPQNGLGYRFSPKMVQEMLWGFSSKLITLELNNKIEGIYCLHLGFPDEPTIGMSEVRGRAIELDLIQAGAGITMASANRRSLKLDSKKAAWVDLIAISREARAHYRTQGVHVYSVVHDTMKEICRLYGVQRVCALLRIGANENLAWLSHFKLGWQMPEEQYQRANPLISNGNQYALICLDI